jgi:hypothetical protein
MQPFLRRIATQESKALAALTLPRLLSPAFHQRDRSGGLRMRSPSDNPGLISKSAAIVSGDTNLPEAGGIW